MHSSIGQIRWRRVLLVVAAVFVGKWAIVIGVVAVYGFKLGLETGGAPDQAKIQQFAQRVAPVLLPIVAVLLTVVTARWVARKNDAGSSVVNGLTVGVLVAVTTLLLSRSFDARLLASFLVTIGAGWLGGLAGRKGSASALLGTPSPGSPPR